ncbi:hypothetical protein G5I_05269 [Acromyrmex echinatior]|uniref:Uncharacterized protein n=1 Tax=Acromyrmex echinatior TaxID=103372 RepID=F4WI00_ACREC|nr:hypothetical protein G5I_05269 [Acromyrmex echinatior]
MLVTPTFLAGALSITVFFPTFAYIRHVTADDPGDIIPSRRHVASARNKKTSSSARGSCELKDRTVINNRFLPAPVCAAPGKASTQDPRRDFFVEALQEVDGGENVGHKNVPVRNGPGEKRKPDEFASMPATVPSGWRLSPAPCIVGVHRLPLVYTGALYGVGITVVLLLQQQPPASNIPPECAHYLSMQPYRFDLSWRPVLPRHACELSRRDGKSSTESFIDHSTINRTSWRLFLGGTAIRYVSTLDEADLKPWPLVIDHRVTVPLPNFKYAHTSQLVTTNYLGRLLALEEAI